MTSVFNAKAQLTDTETENIDSQMARALSGDLPDVSANELFVETLTEYAGKTSTSLMFDTEEQTDAWRVGFRGLEKDEFVALATDETPITDWEDGYIEISLGELHIDFARNRSLKATTWIPELLEEIINHPATQLKMTRYLLAETMRRRAVPYAQLNVLFANYLTIGFDNNDLLLNEMGWSSGSTIKLQFDNVQSQTLRYVIDPQGTISFEVATGDNVRKYGNLSIYQYDDIPKELAYIARMLYQNALVSNKYHGADDQETIENYIKDMASDTFDDSYLPDVVLFAMKNYIKHTVMLDVIADYYDKGLREWQLRFTRNVVMGDILTFSFKAGDIDVPDIVVTVETVSGSSRPLKVTTGQKSSRISRSVSLFEIIQSYIETQLNASFEDHERKLAHTRELTAHNEALRARKNVIIIGSLTTRERVALTVPEQMNAFLNEVQLPLETVVEYTTDEMVEKAKSFGTLVN